MVDKIVMNSFVLKHVSEPEEIMMASKEATAISFLSFFTSMFLLQALGVNDSLLQSFLIGTFIFLVLQAYMIYQTRKDPFFMAVWMASLACQKTKNLFKTKDNHFGD